MRSTRFIAILSAAMSMPFAPMAEGREISVPKDIKSYCLDFNWAERGGFAEPGTWKDADPAATVAWHKAVGSNVIPTHFRIANGNLGVWISQAGAAKIVAAKFEGALDLQNAWTAEKFLNGGNPDSPIQLDRVEARSTDELIEVVVPAKLLEGDPETLIFEWCNGDKVR